MKEGVLHRYSCIRFERLVKLMRAVMEKSVEKPDSCNHALLAVRIHADLLAQAMLDGLYSEEGEKRVLAALLEICREDDEMQYRARRLVDTLHLDESFAETNGSARTAKRGIIGWPRRKLLAAIESLKAAQLPMSDVLGAIPARGLTEGAVFSRALGLPLRFVAFSRARMRTTSILPIDEVWWKQPGQRVLLVDAHVETGETLRACCRYLRSMGHFVDGAVVTDHESASSEAVEDLVPRAAGPLGDFLVLVAGREYTGEFHCPLRGPLLALSGEPGSGKTMIRKVMQRLTGWPVVPWSRAVRRYLDESGGMRWEYVKELAAIELRDPEFVLREVALSPEARALPAHGPLIVDGVKSQSGLNGLARILGRRARLIWVARKADLRKKAVRERGDFDDTNDEERRALLKGLPHLMAIRDASVDTSDSLVDSETGHMRIGRNTANSVRDALEWNEQDCPAPVHLRESAKWVLVAPQQQQQVLILRSAATRKWGLPGGGLFEGESPVDAARRELEEETGLRLDPEECRFLKMIRTGIDFDGVVLEEDVISLFGATSPGWSIQLSSEHVDFHWAGLDRVRLLLPRVWRRAVESVMTTEPDRRSS